MKSILKVNLHILHQINLIEQDHIRTLNLVSRSKQSFARAPFAKFSSSNEINVDVGEAFSVHSKEQWQSIFD